MNFDRYAEEYESALKVANAWNLEVDTADSRLLEPADLRRTAELVEGSIMIGGLKALSLNCGATHATQRYVLRDRDSALNPVITIGWVEVDGKPYFETSRRKLKREMKKNLKRRSRDPLDYHAWFTVQDGDALQIVDCTIAYYLYRKGVVPASQATIWQFRTSSPPEAHEWIEYHPLLAGQKTLEAVGELDEGFNPLD